MVHSSRCSLWSKIITTRLAARGRTDAWEAGRGGIVGDPELGQTPFQELGCLPLSSTPLWGQPLLSLSPDHPETGNQDTLPFLQLK